MRRSLVPVSLIAAATMLAGCSGTSSPDPSGSASANASTQAPASAGATLTIWADATRAPILKDVAADFTAATGVAVSVVERDYGTMRDDFISQAPTGEGPDILIGGGDWTGKFVQNGVVAPIELGDAAAGFAQVALDGVTYQGQVYGLPYALENIAVFRNPALASSTPATFDEAVAIGQAAVDAGKATYPFLIQTDPTSGDPYHLYPLQTSFGADVFGSDGEGGYDPTTLAMDSDGGRAFAEYLAGLGERGVMSSTITADVAKEAFLAGESPYYLTGPWNIEDIVAAIPDVVVEPIPSAGGETASPFVSVQAFFVSALSDNQLAATEFVVNYLGTKEVQLALYEAGQRPPALLAAAEDPAVADDPYQAAFAEVALDGVPMPNIPEMDAVWADWGPTEVAIIDGKGDPTQLWDAATASIESLIAEAR